MGAGIHTGSHSAVEVYVFNVTRLRQDCVGECCCKEPPTRNHLDLRESDLRQ